ncbi:MULTISPECIES: hypothetical protein [Edwardsiella]|uniref:Uncharacterized protein n=1 Tax=Edwardsiella anguillarum TaxID=1821960 RepID=A0ABY8SAT6_9GAMM|nr:MULTISPECIES: hypothetical protein [Edwardsiella]GAJ66189.1 hypothetical protein MA13_contig00001-0312 [Edwardsiella piscicida]UBU94606.1 hypothetical protein AAZ33_19365 [Edwardsiella sp. LADL05-105]UOU77886.1 hypothetical protein MUN71_12505 [Edwardsiella anguillarum]WHP79099.1 hypothetical protein MQ090_11250 [Edwardsiella anguillarum]WHP82600.1 hypothetical protein MQ095_12365 [Edwardsiella anguillarum]
MLGFKHQIRAYYEACRENGLNVTLLDDRESNHFTLVNALANPGSEMFKQVMAMIDATSN